MVKHTAASILWSWLVVIQINHPIHQGEIIFLYYVIMDIVSSVALLDIFSAVGE